MFRLAVCANDAELINVTNAISANIFFMYVVFLFVCVWIHIDKGETKFKNSN